MPRATGEIYDQARELFEPLTKTGRPRCQAFGKTQLRLLRETTPETDWTAEMLAATQCKLVCRPGFSVCWRHGAGKKDSRPGGRPPETGRFSKAMPIALRERYEDAVADPHLLSLREDSALMIARISQILEEWVDQPPAIDEVGDAIIQLGCALQAQDWEAAVDAFRDAEAAVNTSKGQWQAWREIVRLTEQRRKLVSSEITTLQTMNQMLTVQQAMTLLTAVADIILRAELPPETKSKIVAELRALASKQPTTALPG